MKYRIGHGYDAHQFNENVRFRLGGVEILTKEGLINYSDDDVIIHAICDALLGASNLGSITDHLPEKLQNYKGTDSVLLLRKTVDMVREEGYEIGNIDTILLLESPVITSYISTMRETLARTMMVKERDISIKATLSENVGVKGDQKGIAAYVVAMICDLELRKENFHFNMSLLK